jgi:hypothetical protein
MTTAGDFKGGTAKISDKALSMKSSQWACFVTDEHTKFACDTRPGLDRCTD